MRAAFSDPQGPRIVRAPQWLVPGLMTALAVWGPFGSFPSLMIALAALGVFGLAGLVPTRQVRRRSVELECGPGYVDVRNAGARSQRIEARSIVGATSARLDGSVVLTLAHKNRDQPLTLEVDSEADADVIRRSLGIGHGGFGTVSWRTRPGGSIKGGIVGSILLALYALIVGALAISGSTALAIGVGAVLGQVAAVAFVLCLVARAGSPAPPAVVMTSAGLRLLTTRGLFTLPYAYLLNASAAQNAVHFKVPEPYHHVTVPAQAMPLGAGLSEEDREVLVAQVTSAAQRARGLGPDKMDVTGRVDVLRRHGESARDWLVRLDMAGQMLSAGSGYRGNSLDTQDLWAILEDPEADAELRAAAARVLRHSGEPATKTRIAAAVAAVRDEATGRRMRVAIRDDLDDASLELAALDALEPAAARAQMRST